MSFGWVRMKMDTRNRDRQGGHQCSSLKDTAYDIALESPVSRKLNKKRSRKEMRQEHKKVIREAAWQHEVDLNFERQEHLDDLLEQEAAEFNDWYGQCLDDYRDEEYLLSYEDDHPGYDDYYDPYNDCYPWDEMHISKPMYEAGFLSKEGLTRLDLNARIKTEDAGLSLGDILKKQMEQD